MKIRTLWERSADIDECVWIVGAIDEYTDDAGGGDDYYAALEVSPNVRRELVIEIPDSVVYALFRVPTVKGTIPNQEIIEQAPKHYPPGMGEESRRLHREYSTLVDAQMAGEKNGAEVVRLTDEAASKGIVLVPGGEKL